MLHRLAEFIFQEYSAYTLWKFLLTTSHFLYISNTEYYLYNAMCMNFDYKSCTWLRTNMKIHMMSYIHNRNNCDTYYTSSTHTFPYWPYMVLVTELAGSSLRVKRQVKWVSGEYWSGIRSSRRVHNTFQWLFH